ncbi:MAG: hypothetical protein H6626_06200 [Pseudobdellovibrionaceae bacterium]|nr:hypothetical protein [Bdellovibrionales bacterium]USN48680.1 MAG: hypothetical protein H6626_06200 [Pseudobdellovibrionaceae bacterium]
MKNVILSLIMGLGPMATAADSELPPYLDVVVAEAIEGLSEYDSVSFCAPSADIADLLGGVRARLIEKSKENGCVQYWLSVQLEIKSNGQAQELCMKFNKERLPNALFDHQGQLCP